MAKSLSFDANAFLAKIVGEYARELEERLTDDFGEPSLGWASLSPIEFMLTVALQLELRDYPDASGNQFDYCSVGKCGLNFEKLIFPPFDSIDVYPQCKIGQYTADFVVQFVSDGFRGRFVVECDGHDFHERTKEQASHDKRRDRFLQGKGIPIFRYTGSEIWRAPREIAVDIIAQIHRFNDRLHAHG